MVEKTIRQIGGIMREDILRLLEKNAKLTPDEVAAMLGLEPKVVAEEIKKMEQEKIICGYHALIDWDKVNEEKVTAMIEVKISPIRGEGFDRIAERISRFSEVKSVYLISGSKSDLIMTIEGSTMKEIARFVYDKIAPMETVESTATFFVLKKYKEHQEIFSEERGGDERIQGIS